METTTETAMHSLVITSLHDAQIGCSCGHFSVVRSGSMTRREAEDHFQNHLLRTYKPATPEPVGERAQQCSKCGAELLPDIGHSDYQKHVCQRAQHTPVPWTLTPMDNRGWLSVRSPDHRTVAEVICQLPNETRANAALICKAVNNHQALVNALRNTLTAMRNARDMWPNYQPDVQWCNAWDAARTALAACEGEG